MIFVCLLIIHSIDHSSLNSYELETPLLRKSEQTHGQNPIVVYFVLILNSVSVSGGGPDRDDLICALCVLLF